jgi:hypothetical protein
MKLKDASFLIRIYSFLMRNNKVQSPLTDMINIFMTLYEIVFRIKMIKKLACGEIFIKLPHNLVLIYGTRMCFAKF